MPFPHTVMARLKQTHLFAGLNETDFCHVTEGAEYLALGAGEVLFHHGEAAKHFYWLEGGLIKLGRTSPTGEEKVFEVIAPGQTFAEAIMFMGGETRFPVSAQAIQPSQVVRFENRRFLELLNGSVQCCLQMLAGMSRRLHHQINEIDRLTLQNASERVAHYLLQQANPCQGGHQVELRIAKQLLAAQLAIKPETLSRIFAKLSKSGLIEVHGTHIELKDLNALHQLYQGGEM